MQPRTVFPPHFAFCTTPHITRPRFEGWIMASVQPEVAPPICCQRVARINGLQSPPECELLNGSRIALPRLIAAHISSGDEISFPLLNSAVTIGTEIYVSKNSLAGSSRAIYQAPISYVTQPHNNKRGDLYVAAQPCAASLGISSILISCQTLREYLPHSAHSKSS